MIRLENGYAIKTDGDGYTLGTPSTDKQGKQIFKAEGFYSTLAGAVNGYIGMRFRQKCEANDYTLKEAVAVAHETLAEIKRMVGIDI